MTVEPSDDRSPLALAMEWSTVVLAISVEMVIPGLIGYWIDQRLGLRVLFVLLGFAAGMVVSIWHLIRLTSRPKHDGRPTNHPRKPGP